MQKYWLCNYDYGFVFLLTINLAFQVKFVEFTLIFIWFFTAWFLLIILGIKSYHKHALENVQSNHPNVALAPPVEISLNKHNISQAQTVILDAYRYDQPKMN